MDKKLEEIKKAIGLICTILDNHLTKSTPSELAQLREYAQWLTSEEQ